MKPAPVNSSPPVGRVLWPALLIASAGAILLFLTWNRWADPQVDFGRELYLAWRIAEGDVLYRDLASFSGPLSPHLNAALFRVFGPGVHVLQLANIWVLACFTTLSYTLLARETGRYPAAAACVSFLLLCAFAYYGPLYSPFNFIAPYSHEMTHGLLVGAIGLACLSWATTGGWIAFLFVGLSAGTSLLIKPEITLAIVPALVVGMVLLVPSRPDGQRRIPTLVFVLGCLLPPAIYLLVGGVSEGLVGPWEAALNPEVRDVLLYRIGLGLDDPLAALADTGRWLVVWAGLVVGFAWVGRRFDARIHPRFGVGPWAFALALPVALLAVVRWGTLRAFSPLSLILAGLLASLLLMDHRSGNRSNPVRVAGLVFALLLLAKLGLRPRLSWYGFALAAPALMVFVAWLTGPLPPWLARTGGGGSAARGASAALLLVVTLFHAVPSQMRFARKSYPLGSGSDRMLVDPLRGPAFSEALEVLQRSTDEAETVLVVPEGVMLNYLSRRSAPIPVVNFMPPELILFDESRILERLEASPPDHVLWIPKTSTRLSYGGLFGYSFGEALWTWINTRYRAIETYEGADPMALWFRIRHQRPRSNHSSASVTHPGSAP